MNTLQIIALSVVLLFAFLGLYYKIRKNTDSKIHTVKLMQIEREILKHKSQIYRRHQSLNNYDFLKYNISEALVVQLDVNL